MTVHGIDVSSHQGAVDWAAVAGAGIAFGWTKASGGSWYTNPTLGANWSGIRAAGLVRGAYHYAFESSGEPFPGPGPEAEALFFLDRVLPLGIETGDLLALDIEEGPHDVDLGAWALEWCRYVEERVGFRPFIYTGSWFADPHDFEQVPQLAEYPLWLAAYRAPMTEPPRPWDAVTIWQYTDKGMVAGVSGPCDMNELLEAAGPIAQYGKPADGGESAPMPDPSVPIYDPTFPSISQNDSWSCAPTSCRWALYAYGRQPTETWLENSMLSSGVVSRENGLEDASGAGLAAWINREYGEYGYVGSHDGYVTFDDVMVEAQANLHPLMMGGRNWYHWTGVRGTADGKILLANPAPGYRGVAQTLSREQWEFLGPFSMVRLVNPAAEAGGSSPAPPDQSDPYGPWRGSVGSGLIEMMQADGTLPAQRASTWLPLGSGAPSDVEQCLGQNGIDYKWALTVGQGWRYRPS